MPDAVRSAQAVEQDEIEAIKAFILYTAEVWNTQDFRKVLDLWVKDEEAPFYLAEEQDGWFVGWKPLRTYPATPRPTSAPGEGFGRRGSGFGIHWTPDLCEAIWRVHAVSASRRGECIPGRGWNTGAQRPAQGLDEPHCLL